ncbi:MAG: two-component regulator propeller domain-containing protein [Cyclobacteriaceae bacterium]
MKKILLFFFVFVGLNLEAQTPFFYPHLLLKKNDPVKVNKILQDKTGFIWFGTDKGLFKFDGSTYRRFLGMDNLPDENVTALAQDSLGRVWVGFKNGKISFVEKNIIKPFTPAEGMPTKPISDILFDHEGVLWFATNNDGAYYYFNNRLYRLDDIDGMPDLFCYDLEEDKNGNIWVGTDGGIAVCKRTKNNVEIKTITYSNGLPDNIVRKIRRGADNAMYIGTEDAGVFRFDAGNKFTSLFNDKWTYGTISDFLIANDWIWVASAKGLLTIDLRDGKKIKIQSAEQMLALYSDAEGSIWIGSPTGVQRTMGKQLQYIESDENVVAVTVDHNNDVWFSDGRNLIRRKANETTTSKPLTGTPFASKNIISLFTDPDGFIWAGLYGEGVLRIDPKSGSVKSFGKELRNGNVLNISGNGNDIWLATLGGATLIKRNENFSVKNFTTSNGLSTDYIYQVFIDSKKRVWFATDRNGVDMLDENGFHHFKENLDAKVIFGFAEDAQHRIWANVQSAGLFLFDEKQFHPYENQPRIHNSTINIFSTDVNNQLVAIHEQGIDFFDPFKNSFHFLDEQSGIGNRIANLNAVAKCDRGEIYIGTDHGILIYDAQQNVSQEIPKPWIDQLKVNDKIVDLSSNDELKHDENNIKIDFLGFWYQNPEALSFIYQLENYDPDWITTHDRVATYSKLPPGDYIFKLKVSDTHDFSQSVESKIHFVVKPPFWRTTFFYFLVILTLGLSAYLFIHYRERQLLQDKQELEIKVRERTSEIEQKTHEIQAQAEEIRGINENLEALVHDRTSELERKNKALEEYAFINAHQLRAPVASILGLINLMQKLELKDDERVYLEHLKESAKKLDAVVSSITEAIERGDFMKPSSD